MCASVVLPSLTITACGPTTVLVRMSLIISVTYIHWSFPFAPSGWYNHHFFLAYLVTLLWMLLWGIMCCFSAMFLTCSPPDSPSRWSRMMYYAGCKPWITWILINCILHFVWVNLLFMSQILQVSCGPDKLP